MMWTVKNKNTFLLLNNVISIFDLFKILTYYIDDKKTLEVRKLFDIIYNQPMLIMWGQK